MKIYLQHEPGEPFVAHGKPFKDCPRQHAIKLWKKKHRPLEVRDERNCTIATIYVDGNLTIYADLEHREVVQ